jgi:hypothetical protein
MHELVGLHGHPVFLRRDALARGYDDKSLRSAQRDRWIIRVRHGAYTAAQIWSAADERERHRLRAFAVLETHGPGVALSHTTAVVLHGLPVWGANLDQVHITRLDGGTTRCCHDVTYHRGFLLDEQLTGIAGGHRATDLARAVLEHATLVDIESGLTTLDAYLNQHPVAAVERVRDQFVGWPGSQHVRIALGLARKGAESVGESRLRYLCWEYHLPEPELQVPIFDRFGQLVGVSDFAWRERRVLGEFDGKVKYSKHLRSNEDPHDAVFREKRREDRLREASGYSMIRFTWADLFERDRTASRLKLALGLG